MNAVRQHISSILSFLSNLKSRYVCSAYRGTRQDTRADTAGCWCPKDPLLEHQCCQLSLHKLSERKICHMMIRLVFFFFIWQNPDSYFSFLFPPDGSEITSGSPKRHRVHPNVTEVGSDRASPYGQSQSLQLFGHNLQVCVLESALLIHLYSLLLVLIYS